MWNRLVGRTLFVLVLFTISLPGTRGRAEELKVEAATFAKSESDGQMKDVGSIFAPTDRVVLKVVLNDRPDEGELSCAFFLGSQEITVVSVNLNELNASNVPADLNAYGVFTLSPTEPFPISDKYRAEVSFEGKKLGTYPFNIAEAKAAERHATSVQSIVKKLLAASAYVEVQDSGNQSWTGTAWLFDKERRLLVTNDHVADGASLDPDSAATEKLEIYFPEFRNGQVIHDLEYYARNVKPIKAKVIYGDKRQDLAIIQADTLPEGLEALELADRSSSLGETLHSIGGVPMGSKGLWIYTSGKTRAVYDRTLANNLKARVLEADMQTNKGNSGGPVVNDQGKIVAVVEGHSTTARSVSLYVDVSEVRAFLKKSLPLVDAKTIEDLVSRGEYHYEAGRLDQALEDFTEVLRRDPKNAYAMSSKGWVFLERGDLETARVAFESAIALDSTMMVAHRGLARISVENRRFEDAVRQFTKGIVSVTDQEEASEFYRERGLALSQLDKNKAALDDFQRAIDNDASNAWAYCNRGELLTYLGRDAEAIDDFQAAIKIDRFEPDFYWLMSRPVQKLGNLQGALELLTHASKLRPSDPYFYVDLAGVLFAADEPQAAVEKLVKAVELGEGDANLHNEIGVVTFGLPNFPFAYVQFKQASEIEPENDLYWRNLGHAALKLEKYEEAAACLTKSIELNQESSDAYALRGEAHSLVGDGAKSTTDFAKARKLSPAGYKLFRSKYLEIANRTDQTLEIGIQYQAKGTDGKFHWYPANGELLLFEFAPKEVSTLADEGRPIHGAAFRISAVGVETGKVFAKDKSLQAVGASGYLSVDDEAETYQFTITNPQQ